MPTLAVIGAGPKGIAIAAKARALTAAGLPAPRVVLIEPGPVAGNWTGHQGYTSGLLPLGTPPEKDVGYPYAESWGVHSAAVIAAMADYSWQRHLIARGTYADWVDRGRLRPTHRQWSYYLREVADRVEAEIVAAEVVGLEVDGERWRLAVDPGGRSGPTAWWSPARARRSACTASRIGIRGCSTDAATGWPATPSAGRWP